MRRNDEFKFDFNEDAEPVAELHRMRAAMSKHFKTTRALWDYLWDTPTPAEMIAEIDAEIEQEKAAAKTAKKVTKIAKGRILASAASKKKAPARRKTGKRAAAVHA